MRACCLTYRRYQQHGCGLCKTLGHFNFFLHLANFYGNPKRVSFFSLAWNKFLKSFRNDKIKPLHTIESNHPVKQMYADYNFSDFECGLKLTFSHHFPACGGRSQRVNIVIVSNRAWKNAVAVWTNSPMCPVCKHCHPIAWMRNAIWSCNSSSTKEIPHRSVYRFVVLCRAN